MTKSSIKLTSSGSQRDIISNVNPNNVSVVPGVGSGDTYPADLEPGSYVIKKRASRNYTGGVFGNIQTAAQGGTIGRQKFNGAGPVNSIGLTSRSALVLDDVASSTQKAFDKNRRALNQNTQSIHRGTQANQDLQSGAAGAVAALVGLGASISTLDFSSFEAGAASLTNLALLSSFLIPQLKGLGGALKRGGPLASLTKGGRAALSRQRRGGRTSLERLNQIARGTGKGSARASQALALRPLGGAKLAGRAALGAKAGLAGLVTSLVADPLIEFLGSKNLAKNER